MLQKPIQLWAIVNKKGKILRHTIAHTRYGAIENYRGWRNGRYVSYNSDRKAGKVRARKIRAVVHLPAEQ